MCIKWEKEIWNLKWSYLFLEEKKSAFSPPPAGDWRKQTKTHRSRDSLSFLKYQSSNQMGGWERMDTLCNNILLGA